MAERWGSGEIPETSTFPSLHSFWQYCHTWSLCSHSGTYWFISHNLHIWKCQWASFSFSLFMSKKICLERRYYLFCYMAWSINFTLQQDCLGMEKRSEGLMVYKTITHNWGLDHDFSKIFDKLHHVLNILMYTLSDPMLSFNRWIQILWQWSTSIYDHVRYFCIYISFSDTCVENQCSIPIGTSIS